MTAGKRFVFVNLSIECGYNSGINHGIAYLTPVVKRYGYDVHCINIRSEITEKVFVDEINKLAPSIVAYSLPTQQEVYLSRYSNALDRETGIRQIAGGVGPTLDPEGILSRSGVAGVCVGEVEIPLDSLLKNIENGCDVLGTEGFFWKSDGAFKKNPPPQFAADLSANEYPDYSIYRREDVVKEGTLNVILSRGCPYDCHYCCNKALSNVYPVSRKYFRLPSVEHSIAVLESLLQQYPETEFLEFEDDLLIARREWFLQFAELYSDRIKKPYRMCVRVECIKPDIVKALKRSGCMEAYLGLESGSERIRKAVLNRNHSNQLLIEKCKMLQEGGIELFTFNIVGLPFESRREMEETLELNKVISPNKGVCTFFYPYKGTELYRICESNGLLLSDEDMAAITNYNTRPAIKMANATVEECVDIQRKITAYFARQSYATGIARVPAGIKKYPLIMYYRARLFLQQRPWAKQLVDDFGVRKFAMRWFVSKPR